MKDWLPTMPVGEWSISLAGGIDLAVAAASCGSSFGNSLINTNGNTLPTLVIKTNNHNLSKLVSVTPNKWVRIAPPSFDTNPAKFSTDISIANSVASIPGGHNLAANISTGIKVNCPMIVRIRLSPNANQWSSIPIDRLVWVTNNSAVNPNAAENSVVHRKIWRNGIVFKKRWKNHTPTNDAKLVTSLTRPKNSGVNPNSLVLK